MGGTALYMCSRTSYRKTPQNSTLASPPPLLLRPYEADFPVKASQYALRDKRRPKASECLTASDSAFCILRASGKTWLSLFLFPSYTLNRQPAPETGGHQDADVSIKNTGVIPVVLPQTKEKEKSQNGKQLRKLAATFVSSPHALIRTLHTT